MKEPYRIRQAVAVAAFASALAVCSYVGDNPDSQQTADAPTELHMTCEKEKKNKDVVAASYISSPDQSKSDIEYEELNGSIQTTVYAKQYVTLTKEHLIQLQRSPSAPYFGYSLLGAVASVAGYAVNVLWVSRRYVFQTYDATNFIPIYQGELFERLQNAIGCLLMLFGYIPEKGFLSLRGFISMIAFVLLAVLVYCAVKQLKRSSGERYFLTIFLIVAFFLNLFVFTFTTSTMVPRYYLTILMFALPVAAFFLEQEKLPFDRLAVVVILSGCLMISTAKTVFSFISVDKNADKREVAAFLQENDYDFGFATYTNGNIITELTNGEVEIANIGDPQYLEYFKWSSPMKYYEEDYHDGEVFLLLTKGEEMQFANTQALQQGQNVYDDGKYVVLLYDNRADLMECADIR